MRFCPVCDYYLYLQNISAESAGTGEEGGGDTGEGKTQMKAGLYLLCRHCGYSEKMNPDNEIDSLILETTFGASRRAKDEVRFNEFTKVDPTIPHLKTISCPNSDCKSQQNPALRDILYIKTDAKNLQFQYNCTVCDTVWNS